MKSNARGLKRAAREIHVLATSPYLRAAETARVVAEEYQLDSVHELPALTPDRPLREVATWLRRQNADDVVSIVGHEPHLGVLASWFLSGEERQFITLKKGGACLLEFEGKIGPGSATLHWVLTPAQLRALG